jgi:hypothetical protein
LQKADPFPRAHAFEANRFSMVKAVVVIFSVSLAAVAAGDAFAITSLTESQVRNVCGSDLKKTPGHFGCTKKCVDPNSTCIYDCSEKTGECNGVSLPVPASGGDRKDDQSKAKK